jgi:hypothetical protein
VASRDDVASDLALAYLHCRQMPAQSASSLCSEGLIATIA